MATIIEGSISSSFTTTDTADSSTSLTERYVFNEDDSSTSLTERIVHQQYTGGVSASFTTDTDFTGDYFFTERYVFGGVDSSSSITERQVWGQKSGGSIALHMNDEFATVATSPQVESVIDPVGDTDFDYSVVHFSDVSTDVDLYLNSSLEVSETQSGAGRFDYTYTTGTEVDNEYELITTYGGTEYSTGNLGFYRVLLDLIAPADGTEQVGRRISPRFEAGVKAEGEIQLVIDGEVVKTYATPFEGIIEESYDADRKGRDVEWKVIFTSDSLYVPYTETDSWTFKIVRDEDFIVDTPMFCVDQGQIILSSGDAIQMSRFTVPEGKKLLVYGGNISDSNGNSVDGETEIEIFNHSTGETLFVIDSSEMEKGYPLYEGDVGGDDVEVRMVNATSSSLELTGTLLFDIA